MTKLAHRIDQRMKEAAGEGDERSVGEEIIDELVAQARRGERWVLEFLARRVVPEKMVLEGHLGLLPFDLEKLREAGHEWLAEGEVLVVHRETLNDWSAQRQRDLAAMFRDVGVATLEGWIAHRFRTEPALFGAKLDPGARGLLHAQLDRLIDGALSIEALEAAEPERPRPRALPGHTPEDGAGEANGSAPDPRHLIVTPNALQRAIWTTRTTTSRASTKRTASSNAATNSL